MKKKSIFTIIIIAFLLILSVGYALLSDTLNIRGTATATGNFDVEFKEASITKEIGSTNATAIISDDKNSLDINVSKLQYPGAYAEITITVLNMGSVPAKLTDIQTENLDTDDAIKVYYEGLDELKDVSMQQNDAKTFKIKVLWEKSSSVSSESINFSIKLLYKQAV